MKKQLLFIITILVITTSLNGCITYSLSRRITNEVVDGVVGEVRTGISDAFRRPSSHMLGDIIDATDPEDVIYSKGGQLDCSDAWGNTVFSLTETEILELLSQIDGSGWTSCSYQEPYWENAYYLVYSQYRTKAVIGNLLDARVDLFCITFYEGSCYVEVEIGNSSRSEMTYYYMTPEPLFDLLESYM